jgi:ABC-type phosphate transport system permease subunit
MNLRDQKLYQPDQGLKVPGVSGINRKQPKQRKKDYGTEHPSPLENTIMGFAAVVILSVMIIATCIAFPQFAGQQIDKGRKIAEIAMGMQ